MQPENQHPIDYLDSIATVPKGGSKAMNDKLFFGVLLGGVVVALIVGALAFFNTGSSVSNDLAQLSAKLQSTQAAVNTSHRNVISSQLRGINTSLSLALTNANRDIAAPLAANGLAANQLDPHILASESNEELLRRLDDARLNAVFDRTYAREMSYELQTLIVLLGQVEGKTNDKPLQELLSTTRQNIEPIQKQFADFSASTS